MRMRPSSRGSGPSVSGKTPFERLGLPGEDATPGTRVALPHGTSGLSPLGTRVLAWANSFPTLPPRAPPIRPANRRTDLAHQLLQERAHATRAPPWTAVDGKRMRWPHRAVRPSLESPGLH